MELRYLQFIADGTDSLAELERANPVLGERLKDFVNTIDSCCREAYERFSVALGDVLTLSSNPSETEKSKVLAILKNASNSEWFRNVAKICDQLAAVADTYDSDIKRQISRIEGDYEQSDRHYSLSMLLEILHKHEGDLKQDIRRSVNLLKVYIADSEIAEARKYAISIQDEIDKTLTRIHGVSVRITGSFAQGAIDALTKVQMAEPASMLQDDRKWYVSYAWGEDSTAEGRARENVVDKLCAAVEARGRKILRDKNVLGLGQSISAFMQDIGAGDRIFVILSDKYLRSPYCMFELSEIWRTSKQEGSAFLERVRVYALRDAKVSKPSDWVDWAIYWKKEHDALNKRAQQYGAAILGQHGHDKLMQMQRFFTQVADILGTLADIVQPRSLEELERYGFDDPPTP
jgi:internalin A